MSRVTHLSLSRSFVITFVLLLYQDTGQGATITSCGFESASICGYSQLPDHYDQFDWTRRSGATPTADTGPSSAYEGSYYMYLDTRYNNPGDKAIIYAPSRRRTGTLCVSLAYHMYGEDIGTLRLFRYVPRLYLLEKTGNQGNKWIQYQERINSLDIGTTYYIEGHKGTGDKGDIAIDDFSIVTGTCKITVPLPYSCSFESDLGHMWQTDSDDLDWIRTHTSAPTPAFGSPGDSSGSWIISLASDGHNNPEVASIETPELDFDGDICVRFKYYLSNNFSYLSVLRENANWLALEYLDSVATGAIWRSVSLTVRNFARNHWITFSGRLEGGQAASIALDEISISTQLCDDCAVGNGGCNQICSRTDTGRTCSCRSGYVQFGETGCQDLDECAISIAGCQQRCENVEGSYSCSCDPGYVLTSDEHNCHAECESAYERRVAASQLFTSDCPTTTSHIKITLDDCLLEACSTQTGVVAYFNMVCDLKDCDGSNLRLKIASGSSGWDIYVLNTTWPGSINGGNPDDFPLVAVVAGVVVPVILLVVIVIAVVFIMRRRGSTREGDQSVHYVNDAGQPGSVGEVRAPPINENHTEVGMYDEVTETPERQAAMANIYIT